MNAPIPCNCWLMDIERRHDEPPCPSPCVFDDPSERVDDCSDAMMLRDAGNSKTDCVHYRAAVSAAELTDPAHTGRDRELLEAFYVASIAEGGSVDEITLRGIQAAIAADRAARLQPDWQPINTAPTDGTEILASDYDTIEIVNWSWHAWETGSGWIDRDGRRLYPAWWRPLPEHPPIPTEPTTTETTND